MLSVLLLGEIFILLLFFLFLFARTTFFQEAYLLLLLPRSHASLEINLPLGYRSLCAENAARSLSPSFISSPFFSSFSSYSCCSLSSSSSICRYLHPSSSSPPLRFLLFIFGVFQAGETPLLRDSRAVRCFSLPSETVLVPLFSSLLFASFAFNELSII